MIILKGFVTSASSHSWAQEPVDTTDVGNSPGVFGLLRSVADLTVRLRALVEEYCDPTLTDELGSTGEVWA